MPVAYAVMICARAGPDIPGTGLGLWLLFALALLARDNSVVICSWAQRHSLIKLQRVFILQSTDKKKGGKFQPFKKLFGKRKKKDTTLSQAGSSGKKSHSPLSVNNGNFSSDEETLEDNLR
jgi:hypothetical protein